MTLRRMVSEYLVERGFRHIKAGKHLRPIEGPLSFVVDTGPLDGYGDIAPGIGLRHDGVEALRARLIGSPFTRHAATVIANVGIVLGEGYRTWSSPEDLAQAVGAIERALEVTGGYASLDRLPSWWDRPGVRVPNAYTAATVYLILGDDANVNRWLREGERTQCRLAGPVCEQFRRFERNVLDALAQSGDTPPVSERG